MTPEELDFGDSNYADDSIKVIAKLKEEITQANHRYADLQNVCDDQDKEIKRLEDHHCEDCCCARSWEALGITEYTGRSIPEEITRTREQIKRLEDALVEERGKLFHQFGDAELDKPTESDCWFAREQLRDEGVIR